MENKTYAKYLSSSSKLTEKLTRIEQATRNKLGATYNEFMLPVSQLEDPNPQIDPNEAAKRARDEEALRLQNLLQTYQDPIPTTNEIDIARPAAMDDFSNDSGLTPEQIKAREPERDAYIQQLKDAGSIPEGDPLTPDNIKDTLIPMQSDAFKQMLLESDPESVKQLEYNAALRQVPEGESSWIGNTTQGIIRNIDQIVEGAMGTAGELYRGDTSYPELAGEAMQGVGDIATGLKEYLMGDKGSSFNPFGDEHILNTIGEKVSELGKSGREFAIEQYPELVKQRNESLDAINQYKRDKGLLTKAGNSKISLGIARDYDPGNIDDMSADLKNNLDNGDSLPIAMLKSASKDPLTALQLFVEQSPNMVFAANPYGMTALTMSLYDQNINEIRLNYIQDKGRLPTEEEEGFMKSMAMAASITETTGDKFLGKLFSKSLHKMAGSNTTFKKLAQAPIIAAEAVTTEVIAEGSSSTMKKYGENQSTNPGDLTDQQVSDIKVDAGMGGIGASPVAGAGVPSLVAGSAEAVDKGVKKTKQGISNLTTNFTGFNKQARNFKTDEQFNDEKGSNVVQSYIDQREALKKRVDELSKKGNLTAEDIDELTNTVQNMEVLNQPLVDKIAEAIEDANNKNDKARLKKLNALANTLQQDYASVANTIKTKNSDIIYREFGALKTEEELAGKSGNDAIKDIAGKVTEDVQNAKTQSTEEAAQETEAQTQAKVIVDAIPDSDLESVTNVINSINSKESNTNDTINTVNDAKTKAKLQELIDTAEDTNTQQTIDSIKDSLDKRRNSSEPTSDTNTTDTTSKETKATVEPSEPITYTTEDGTIEEVPQEIADIVENDSAYQESTSKPSNVKSSSKREAIKKAMGSFGVDELNNTRVQELTGNILSDSSKEVGELYKSYRGNFNDPSEGLLDKLPGSTEQTALEKVQIDINESLENYKNIIGQAAVTGNTEVLQEAINKMKSFLDSQSKKDNKETNQPNFQASVEDSISRLETLIKIAEKAQSIAASNKSDGSSKVAANFKSLEDKSNKLFDQLNASLQEEDLSAGTSGKKDDIATVDKGTIKPIKSSNKNDTGNSVRYDTKKVTYRNSNNKKVTSNKVDFNKSLRNRLSKLVDNYLEGKIVYIPNRLKDAFEKAVNAKLNTKNTNTSKKLTIKEDSNTRQVQESIEGSTYTEYKRKDASEVIEKSINKEPTTKDKQELAKAKANKVEELTNEFNKAVEGKRPDSQEYIANLDILIEALAELDSIKSETAISSIKEPAFNAFNDSTFQKKATNKKRAITVAKLLSDTHEIFTNSLDKSKAIVTKLKEQDSLSKEDEAKLADNTKRIETGTKFISSISSILDTMYEDMSNAVVVGLPVVNSRPEGKIQSITSAISSISSKLGKWLIKNVTMKGNDVPMVRSNGALLTNKYFATKMYKELLQKSLDEQNKQDGTDVQITEADLEAIDSLWHLASNIHNTIKSKFNDVNSQPNKRNGVITFMNESGKAQLDIHRVAAFLHKGYMQKANDIDPVISHNLAMSLINWMGASSTFNNKEGVAKLFGLTDVQPTPAFQALAQKYSNKPNTVKKAANDIGMDFLGALNIETNKDMSVSFKRELASQFGLLALSAGITTKVGSGGTPLLESTSVPISEFVADNNSVGGKAVQGETIKTESKIVFVRPSVGSEKDNRFTLSNNLKKPFDKIKEGNNLIERLTGITNRTIGLQDKPSNALTTARRLGVDLPKKALTKLQKLLEQEWELNTEIVEQLLAENGEIEVFKILTGVEKDIKDLSDETLKELATASDNQVELQSGVEYGYVGARESVIRAKEHIQRLKNKHGEDYAKRSYYFPYDLWLQGRIGNSSNTLNPQADKLHRLLIKPRTEASRVTTEILTKAGDERNNYLKGAVVLFDIDDKTSLPETKTAITEVRDMFFGKGAAIDFRKSIVDVYNDDTLSFSAKVKKLEELFASREPSSVAGKKSNPLSAPKGVNAYLAATEIVNIVKKEPFNTLAIIEVDGVTSGFAITLMLFPVLGKQQVENQEKVGIFTDPSRINVDRDDSYQDISRKSTKGLEDTFEALNKEDAKSNTAKFVKEQVANSESVTGLLTTADPYITQDETTGNYKLQVKATENIPKGGVLVSSKSYSLHQSIKTRLTKLRELNDVDLNNQVNHAESFTLETGKPISIELTPEQFKAYNDNIYAEHNANKDATKPVKEAIGALLGDDAFPSATGKISKAMRNLVKYPFMIINYGGSLFSIEKAVASGVVRDFYKRLQDIMDMDSVEAKEAALKEFKDKLSIVDLKFYNKGAKGKRSYKSLSTMKVSDLQTAVLEPDSAKYLEETLGTLLGKSITSAIQKTLGRFEVVRSHLNATFHLQYEVFKKALNNELEALKTDENGYVDNNRKPTEQEYQDIIDKLQPLIPRFESYFGNGKKGEGYTAFDMEVVSNNNNVTIEFVLPNQKSLTTTPLQKKVVSIGVGANPLQVQSLDAAVMTLIAAQVADVMHVHDAIKGFPGNIEEGGKLANEAFMDVMQNYDMFGDAVRSLGDRIEAYNELYPISESSLDNTNVSEFVGSLIKARLEDYNNNEDAERQNPVLLAKKGDGDNAMLAIPTKTEEYTEVGKDFMHTLVSLHKLIQDNREHLFNSLRDNGVSLQYVGHPAYDYGYKITPEQNRQPFLLLTQDFFRDDGIELKDDSIFDKPMHMQPQVKSSGNTFNVSNPSQKRSSTSEVISIPVESKTYGSNKEFLASDAAKNLGDNPSESVYKAAWLMYFKSTGHANNIVNGGISWVRGQVYVEPSNQDRINVGKALAITQLLNEGVSKRVNEAAEKIHANANVEGEDISAIVQDIFDQRTLGDGGQLKADTIVNKDSVNSTYGFISENDNVDISQPFAERLLEVLNKIVSPGMETIGDVSLLLKDNLAEMRNGNFGQFSEELKTILVAKRSTGSNFSGQSLREITVHEMIHAVLSKAINELPLERRKQIVNLFNTMQEYYSKKELVELLAEKDSNGNYTDGSYRRAELTYEYIFENSSTNSDTAMPNGIHEFIAYTLTNEAFMLAAEQVPTSKKRDFETKFLNADNVLARVANWFFNAIENFWLKRSKDLRGDNVRSEVFAVSVGIISQLQHSGTKAKMNLYDRVVSINEKVSDKIEDANDAVNEKISSATDKLTEGLNKSNPFRTNDDKVVDELTKTRMVSIAAVGVYGRLKASNAFTDEQPNLQPLEQAMRDSITTYGDLKRVMQRVAPYAIDRDGTLRQAIDSMLTPTQDRRMYEKLFREYKNDVEATRKNWESVASSGIKDSYIHGLTDSEDTSLNSVLGRTDLVTVLDYYNDNYDKLLEVLENRDSLAKEAANLLIKIENLSGSKYFPAIRKQAYGLGLLIVDPANPDIPRNQMSNAMNVADGMAYKLADSLFTSKMRKSIGDNRAELIKTIDAYASLVALQNTKQERINDTVRVFKREMSTDSKSNGITATMAFLRTFKQESGTAAFDNKDGEVVGNSRLMLKGYLTATYQEDFEFKLIKSVDLAKEERHGWIDVSSDHKNSFGLGNEEVVIVTRRNYQGSNRNTGMVGGIGLHHRGTNIDAVLQATNPDIGYEDAKRYKEKLAIKMSKAAFAEQVKGQSIPVDLVGNPLPITNSKGTITDYRYEMSEDKQVAMLKKEDRLTENLGKSYASLHAKEGGKHVDVKVLTMLGKDYEENYASNPSDFIWLNGNDTLAHGEPNPYKLGYDTMADHVKARAYRLWGSRGIPVRRGSISLIIGQDNIHISNFSVLEFAQKAFPDVPIKRWIDIAEHIVKNIVSISKMDVVIRTLDVPGLNVLSNVVSAALYGVPLAKIAPLMIQGTKYLNEHLRTDREIIKLQIELAGTKNKARAKQLAAKITNLESMQKSNPAAKLLDENMYPVIAEDVDINSSGLLDAYKTKFDSKIPDLARQGINLAFLTKDSAPFKLVAKFTQVSDFAARYAQFTIEMERNTRRVPSKKRSKDEIIDEVMDTYIYYDIYDSPILEFLNNIGFVQFTKFLMRIQRVLLGAIRKRAVNTAGLAVLQTYVHDVEDIFQQALISKDISIIFYSLMDHIENFLNPEGLMYALKLIRDD